MGVINTRDSLQFKTVWTWKWLIRLKLKKENLYLYQYKTYHNACIPNSFSTKNSPREFSATRDTGSTTGDTLHPRWISTKMLINKPSFGGLAINGSSFAIFVRRIRATFFVVFILIFVLGFWKVYLYYTWIYRSQFVLSIITQTTRGLWKPEK